MSCRRGAVDRQPIDPADAAAHGWSFYGADQGGSRYSAAREITPSNVADLRRAWIYRTGDETRRDPALMKRVKFQTTPILVADKLVLCTPFNEIIALDPASGRELWRHDPRVATDRRPANRYNCRGVASWRDPAIDASSTAAGAGSSACAVRIFAGTVDARLFALDASTGVGCRGFGTEGEVRLDTDQLDWPGEFQISSAPVVAHGVVIVGSAINDNGRVDAPSGKVRAFDARTGGLRWTWDPVPRDASDPAVQTWGEGWRDVGGANVWAPMSIDEERGLVFLPTSSPSPDFYGGLRPGANRHADSVVALRVKRRLARLGLSDRQARRVGLRRARAADAGAHRRRRRAARRGDPGDQAGPGLRARPRYRRASLPGRGARRAARRRTGRGAVSDADFPGRPPRARAVARAPGGRLRLHAVRPRRLPRAHRGVAQRRALHAANGAGNDDVPVHRWRRELGRRRDRPARRGLRQHESRGALDLTDSACRLRCSASSEPGQGGESRREARRSA